MRHTTHVVIMGVAGSGKTTVAELLAQKLGWECAEADDFHPASNIAKMTAGTPLTDDDRWPWLRAIRDWISAADREGRSTIVTCSALKRSYRDVLREADGQVFFVHLAGSPQLIADRMTHRSGHFMPPALLPSQFEALEPLQPDEDGVAVQVDATPEEIVETIVTRLRLACAA